MAGPQSVHTRSKSPTDVLAEAEQQWIYTEEDLLHTPSILDGMPPAEERLLRGKAVNFITQVGIMLKLPQTTLATASVFCNRYLMRNSLVKKPGYTPLHHYQVAAISLFIATKVEEHTRKVKDLVVACVRVALKKPDLHVDEQTKDFWRWRDTIVYNEDLVLEMLAFDLTIDSPYKLLYDFLKIMNLHHNRKFRDATWAFVNDTYLTNACLLFTSKIIAATALYFAQKTSSDGMDIPNGSDGRPWWQAHRVKLMEVKKCMNYMAEYFEIFKNAAAGAGAAAAAGGGGAGGAGSKSDTNPYASLKTPLDGSERGQSPALTVSPYPGTQRSRSRSRRTSPVVSLGEDGRRGVREEDGGEEGDGMEGVVRESYSRGRREGTDDRGVVNGSGKPPVPRVPPGVPRVPPAGAVTARKRGRSEEREDGPRARAAAPPAEDDDDDGSEEGEI